MAIKNRSGKTEDHTWLGFLASVNARQFFGDGDLREQNLNGIRDADLQCVRLPRADGHAFRPEARASPVPQRDRALGQEEVEGAAAA